MPPVLIVGTGRCGSMSVARYLDRQETLAGREIRACHETDGLDVVTAVANGNVRVAERLCASWTHEVESAPYLGWGWRPAGARVLRLVRDGRKVVASGMARDWYRWKNVWTRAKPQFEGDLFEKCCKFWTHMAEQGADYRLEDLVADEATQCRLHADLGLKYCRRPFPSSNEGSGILPFADWQLDHYNKFRAICGEQMDRLYPGWRD